MGRVGMTEIIVVALIILLLFGGRKIPELMKGLGRGVKGFKDGMNGKFDESEEDSKTSNEKLDKEK